MPDTAEPENPEEEVVEEETPGPEQEETGAEKPAETTPVKPQQPADEIKVVIIMKADNVMLGVQSPDCDPVYKTMKGDLAMTLQQVPGLVAEAKQKWATAPRYPKANLPEPPPSPTPARIPVASAPAKPKAQPSFF